MEKKKEVIGSTEFKKADERLDGVFYVDMHFHSNLDNGFLKMKPFLSELKRKMMAVAITDHNSINGAIRLHDNMKESIVPSIEVIPKEGTHLIFYFFYERELSEFYNKFIKKNIDKKTKTYLTLTRDEVIDISRRYNCISCLPHPFTYFNSKVHRGLKYLVKRGDIDSIETINGFIPHRHNLNSSKFSCSVKTSVSGGTDGRTLKELGNVLTCAEASTVEEFLEMLRKGKTKVIGTESCLMNKIRNLIYRPEMKARYLPSYIKKRLKVLATHY